MSAFGVSVALCRHLVQEALDRRSSPWTDNFLPDFAASATCSSRNLARQAFLLFVLVLLDMSSRVSEQHQ